MKRTGIILLLAAAIIIGGTGIYFLAVHSGQETDQETEDETLGNVATVIRSVDSGITAGESGETTGEESEAATDESGDATGENSETAGESGESSGADVRASYREYAEALAVYPARAAYPVAEDGTEDENGYKAWRLEQTEREENAENYPQSYTDFAWETMQRLLTSDAGDDESDDNLQDTQIRSADENDENGENVVYSPLSIYMALAMLAETTDGDSRAQILEALGATDIETLRTQTEALWLGNYQDDGAVTSILGASLWLDESFSCKQTALDALAEHYYASTFRGSMTSESYLDAISSWLDSQTGGLLTETTKNLEYPEETVMVLFSTIYYQAKWEQTFAEEENTQQTFHAASGDVTCEFMNQTMERATLYRGDNYSAVYKEFSEGGGMWLILPGEDVPVDDLLQDEELADMLKGQLAEYDTWWSSWEWENSAQFDINLSMPKFDITSSLDLTDLMLQMGITDIFDAGTADFSALSDRDDLFLSGAKHEARVVVDEDGVTAAAYTEMALMGDALYTDEMEEINFVLDRPFLFVMVSDTGTILFAGEIRQPE